MRHAFSLLALPLLALPLAQPTVRTRTPQEPRSIQEGKEQHQEEEDTELAHQMESIEQSVKRLRKSLKDESLRADSLQTLAEIQSLTLACKSLSPAAAAKLPEVERADFVRAYRHTMIDFLTRQLELEAALLDGDAEGTETAFDRFREMEDSSHERFAPEDD